LGVRLVLNARVIEVKANQVLLKDGSSVQARTCLWCAGVQASPLVQACGLPIDKSGRIPISDDLRVEGFPHVFVLGDAAHFVDKKTNKSLPPLGQVAFQQGSHTAQNLVRLLQGKETKPFKYFNFGSLVSVGEHYAAVNLLGVKISGFFGWIIWRFLYLSKIIGMSNRIRIVVDWTMDLLIERSITQFRTEELQDHPHVIPVKEAIPTLSPVSKE
jgi:NADH dehydrogenase